MDLDFRSVDVDRTVTTVIDAERCIGCGKCIPVCPSETLAMRDGKAVVVGAESLQCGHCAAVCPTDAIRVDALDPDMLAFRTFQVDTRWMSPASSDAAGLVRLMASRRSCRNYLADAVPREALDDLVKAACTAPSGTNNQGWTFTVLADRPAVIALGNRVLTFFQKLCGLAANPVLRNALRLVGKAELHEFHRDYAPKVRLAIDEFKSGGRDRLFHGAPAVILICSGRDATTPAEDALLATQNLLLAAHAMGYGTCLIGFVVEAMRRDRSIGAALGIPSSERIRAVVALGRPAESWKTIAGRRAVTPRYVDAATIARGRPIGVIKG
jgi:nitroreductase/NAD-dependent dihydropyrimidine dehydrogenase PreA subunit